MSTDITVHGSILSELPLTSPFTFKSDLPPDLIKTAESITSLAHAIKAYYVGSPGKPSSGRKDSADPEEEPPRPWTSCITTVRSLTQTFQMISTSLHIGTRRLLTSLAFEIVNDSIELDRNMFKLWRHAAEGLKSAQDKFEADWRCVDDQQCYLKLMLTRREEYLHQLRQTLERDPRDSQACLEGLARVCYVCEELKEFIESTCATSGAVEQRLASLILVACCVCYFISHVWFHGILQVARANADNLLQSIRSEIKKAESRTQVVNPVLEQIDRTMEYISKLKPDDEDGNRELHTIAVWLVNDEYRRIRHAWKKLLVEIQTRNQNANTYLDVRRATASSGFNMITKHSPALVGSSYLMSLCALELETLLLTRSFNHRIAQALETVLTTKLSFKYESDIRRSQAAQTPEGLSGGKLPKHRTAKSICLEWLSLQKIWVSSWIDDERSIEELSRLEAEVIETRNSLQDLTVFRAFKTALKECTTLSAVQMMSNRWNKSVGKMSQLTTPQPLQSTKEYFYEILTKLMSEVLTGGSCSVDALGDIIQCSTDALVKEYIISTKGTAEVISGTCSIPAGTLVDVLVPFGSEWAVRYCSKIIRVPREVLRATSEHVAPHVEYQAVRASWCRGSRSTSSVMTSGDNLLGAVISSLRFSAKAVTSVSWGPSYQALLDNILGALSDSPDKKEDTQTPPSTPWQPLSEEPPPSSAIVVGNVKHKRSTTTYGKARPTTEDDEFRWLFGYENKNCHVLSQFNCALSGKILLQGKMWITTTAIGFYSIFNDETFLSSIPTVIRFELSAIKHLYKKNNAIIFSNSIEFVLTGGEKYFFTSYVRRDKAWALLMKLTNYRFETPSNIPACEALVSHRHLETMKDMALARKNSIADDSSAGMSDQGYCTPPSLDPAKLFSPPSSTSAWPQDTYMHRITIGLYDAPLGEAVEKLLLSEEYFNRMRELEGSKDLQRTDSEPPTPLQFEELESDLAYCRENTWNKKLANKSMFVKTDWVKVQDFQTIVLHPSRQQAMLLSRVVVAGIPFCESFNICTRLVVTALSAESTQVQMEFNVRWLKSCLVKGTINSQAVEEWQNTIGDVTRIVNSLLPSAKRRSRRTGSSNGERSCGKRQTSLEYRHSTCSRILSVVNRYIGHALLIGVLLVVQCQHSRTIRELLNRIEHLESAVSR